MALNHKELMCVYFGFVSANEHIDDDTAKQSLQFTAELLGISKEDYFALEAEALEGLKKVNQFMEKMLKQIHEGKDPFDKKGGDEEWR